MLSKEEATKLVKEKVVKKNIFSHSLAVGALMKSLAKFLKEDEEKWELTGLLHDIDFGITEKSPEKHGILAEEILKGLVPEEIIKAIKSHNFEVTKVLPNSNMEKALIACDAISGLLVACALVMPSKKIKEVKLQTVIKKFKDKDFARGANRDRILFCKNLGISKEKFFEISLEALKSIDEEIGL
ncbi:MAG: HDIG domain-containing protein [Candidatus Bathyarchaeia archaeon]